MKLAKHLVDGLKMTALFAAIALVVWSMPDYDGARAEVKSSANAASPTIRD
jgi:hypothetical protein